MCIGRKDKDFIINDDAKKATTVMKLSFSHLLLAEPKFLLKFLMDVEALSKKANEGLFEVVAEAVADKNPLLVGDSTL